MKTWERILAVSLLIGSVMAGITGLFQTPGRIGIDVIYWGFPVSWWMRVIPTHIESLILENLLFDIVFWVVLVFVILFVVRLLTRTRQ